MPFLNYGRNNLAMLLLVASVGVALLAVMACGGSSNELAGSPTAPAGMFSTLPTEESPVLGDQPPTIELNTPEPTLTPQPTPTPNPTYTPVPTLTPTPTPDPTGTPIPLTSLLQTLQHADGCRRSQLRRPLPSQRRRRPAEPTQAPTAAPITAPTQAPTRFLLCRNVPQPPLPSRGDPALFKCDLGEAGS